MHECKKLSGIVAVIVLAGCGPVVEPEPTELPPLTVGVGALPSPAPTSTSISEPAVATALAVRPMIFMQITPTLPPPPPPPTPDGPAWARCPQWWSEARDVGWAEGDLANMDRIMWRESNCRPEVYNRFGANGLMQIMNMWADDCGMTIAQLRTAVPNLECALHVLHVQGWGAWSTN